MTKTWREDSDSNIFEQSTQQSRLGSPLIDSGIRHQSSTLTLTIE